MLRGLTSWLYGRVGKPILFLFPADSVHSFMVGSASMVGQIAPLRGLLRLAWRYENRAVLSQEILGLKFDNPVGLSAGLDKNCQLLKFTPSLGFGFEECGSITAEASAGNPRPHYRRLPKTISILVNAGLNNDGVVGVTRRIRQAQTSPVAIRPLNISVAKTNCPGTATETAGIHDYVTSLKHIKRAKVGDMVTLNISCPNAYGGEPFTTTASLDKLLSAVDRLSLRQMVFVKMPIDLDWKDFRALLDVILQHRVAGVTIGNLRKNRSGANLSDPLPAGWPGNLSGRPTWQPSNELISQTYRYCGQKLVIIGVGGILNADDAYEKIRRGASLVEIITGLIFGGPQVPGQINHDLAKLLARDGFSNISEAVGVDSRS